MSILNDIITYWYKCVEYEDFIGSKISLNSKNTLLAPLNSDPFIFKIDDNADTCLIKDNKEMEIFHSASALKNIFRINLF